MSKSSTRNGYIDLLKFVFSLGILGVHTAIIGFDNRLIFCGYLGVDFFFMISGYYITKEAVKASKGPMRDNAIARNFAKRIKSFYPFFWHHVFIALSFLR